MSKFKAFLNQDYESIKQKLLSTGELFEDDQFPASDSSLFKLKPLEVTVSWERPSQICEKQGLASPKFIVGKIEPNDLDQGTIGDCWLISAMSAVASVPEYTERVIPSDQSFETNYAGIFRFRFWQFGEWIEVVVDDKLPVDENCQFVYCRNSKDSNEMFGPLLEKAYAKLMTCYEFLDGGDSVDALIDMTGGVHERFKFKKEKSDDGSIKVVNSSELWNIIFKSFSMKSLIGASIDSRNGKGDEFIQDNGLALGHAYSVLEAFEIVEKNGNYELRDQDDPESDKNSIKLLKIRNPWGETKSYTGKWSPQSVEWSKISPQIKKAIKMDDQTDGQFLVELSEFTKEFDEIEMVHVNFDAFIGNEAGASNVNWVQKQLNGSWKKGLNAGGCGNDRIEDFWKNPQYLISLKLENNQDNLVSLIFSIMQKDQNKRRLETDGSWENSNQPMNCSVYKVNPGVGSKKKYIFSDLEEVFSHPAYLTQRELVAKLDLEPGDYVIIPSLFEKEAEGNFLIRLLIEGEAKDVKLKGFDLNKKKKPKNESKLETNEENGETQMMDKKEQKKKDKTEKKDKKESEKEKEQEEKQEEEQEKEQEEEEEKDEEQEEEYEEEYEDEYEDNYEEVEIPEDYKTKRKNFEKKIIDKPIGPGGQVVSRACLIM